MQIETERLIIRDVLEKDAESLLEIYCDEQVMKFHQPAFIYEDERTRLEYMNDVISYFRKLAKKGLIYDKKHPERGCFPIVCLKDTGEIIGFLTFNRQSPINEWGLGWFFSSRHTRKGYATEAATAVSEYYLDVLSLDYISCNIRNDNIASFKVALKSGFTLKERRIQFNYDNANCNVEDISEVNEYFDKIKSGNDSCEFYFQKFNKNRVKEEAH